MKKKLLYTLLLSSAISINTSRSQQFIRDYNITTTGVSQDWPVDVNYLTGAQNKYMSLHHSSNGNMPVLKYDGTTYASLGGANLFQAGVLYDPQAMIHKGNATAVLFNVPSANPSYGICTFNHTLNTIAWANDYAYPNTDYSIVSKDMVVDAVNTLLYVVGDIYDNNTGRSGIYIAQIDGNTGVLNWNMQITNGVYDFSSNNIFFNSVNDIYIAAGASDPTNLFNRGAYIVDINSAGTIGGSTFIKYDTDCNYHRMTSPSVKRLNSDVYVFCPSVIGPDGSGNYFLAKFNSTLTTMTNSHIYFAGSFYFNDFIAPKFEFVNNNQNIMVSGTRSLLNSSIPGYIHAIYDLNTAYVSSINYPNQSVGIYGNPIIDCYNPGTDQVFTVAKDWSTPSTYYGFRSNSNGNIDDHCDTVYNQDSVDCRLLTPGLDVTTSQLHETTTMIKLKISAISQDYKETCTHTPCADCELAVNNGGINKSLSAPDKKQEWNVYPNPASTSLEIEYGNNIQTIVITNVKGQQVKIINNVNALHMSIDINELPKGMYFINAVGTDGKMINKKIIKE